eukprot:7124737-Pyramimonas_sp.AAC.1
MLRPAMLRPAMLRPAMLRQPCYVSYVTLSHVTAAMLRPPCYVSHDTPAGNGTLPTRGPADPQTRPHRPPLTRRGSRGGPEG